MRPKVIDTVLGPVTLKRAWYHCRWCRHGLAPRDAELGVTGMSMSPGLAAMNDLAATAGPFAGAARLIEELAGNRLTVKRVERTAEASGTALAAAVPGRASLIGTRKLVPDKLYAVIDGTGVPMTSKETAGREGKGDDGEGAHPRGQACCLLHPGRVHPGRAGRGRLPCPRPGVHQRHRLLRARRRIRETRAGRGRPPRRGPYPPAHRHR